MGKKVLILSSSPRRNGNSDLLCDRFAEGAGEAGHQVEKIRLAEKKIGYCTACYACRKGKCPQLDDAPEILEKMLAADVIVLATPVYFYTMCAQLKALLDRTVAIFPRLTDKQGEKSRRHGEIQGKKRCEVRQERNQKSNPESFTETLTVHSADPASSPVRRKKPGEFPSGLPPPYFLQRGEAQQPGGESVWIPPAGLPAGMLHRNSALCTCRSRRSRGKPPDFKIAISTPHIHAISP